MKRVLAGLAAGIVVGSAGVAGATLTRSSTKAIPLTPGQAVSYSGLTCTAYGGATLADADIVCVRDNLKGFGVVVSQSEVVVAKRVSGKIRVFFRHANR